MTGLQMIQSPVGKSATLCRHEKGSAEVMASTLPDAGRNRTVDLRISSPALSPSELQRHNHHSTQATKEVKPASAPALTLVSASLD